MLNTFYSAVCFGESAEELQVPDLLGWQAVSHRAAEKISLAFTAQVLIWWQGIVLLFQVRSCRRAAQVWQPQTRAVISSSSQAALRLFALVKPRRMRAVPSDDTVWTKTSGMCCSLKTKQMLFTFFCLFVSIKPAEKKEKEQVTTILRFHRRRFACWNQSN